MFQNKIVATFCVVLLSLFSLEAQQQVTVWPGDTDNNGLVNNLDFLQIGLAYNYLGTVRDTATVQWSGQTASPWTTNPAGINSAYADANGDGLVNYFYDAFHILFKQRSNFLFINLLYFPTNLS